MPQTTFIWALKDDVTAGAKRLNNQLDQMGVRSKGATGALQKLGVATGGLVTPTSIAAAGALAFVGIMADATRKAIDEEKNIAKLGAALQANIPDWDGNTNAIERLISKRENLAFSDDELRDSLGTLVAATHDVTKAEDIQSTAMDLARFKHISLADATDALTKVEAGSYRILKSLGITLKDNATQTDALAAVTAVAKGQAQAFADTTEGKLLTAQIKLDDAMERLGGTTMPMVAAAAGDLSTALDLLAGNTDGSNDATQKQADLSADLLDVLGLVNPALHLQADAIRAVSTASKTADARMQKVSDSLDVDRKAFNDATGAAQGYKTALMNMNTDADKSAAHIAELNRLLRQQLYLMGKTGYNGNPNSGKPGHGDQGHASGGPLMPGVTKVGENGPEYLIASGGGNARVSHSTPGGRMDGGAAGSGVTIQGISERELVDMVDRGLFFKLQRAAPTIART